MKNILLIIPYGSVGGIERLALNLYNQYKSQGYIVKAIKLIQLESDIIHFGEDEIVLSQVDFCQMSFLKRFFFYCTIPFLIHHIIKKNKITHSISFGDMANVFSSLSFSKEFKIGSIHSFKSIEFTEQNFLNRIFKLAFKTTYFFFDKVVCISEAVKLDLISNCSFRFKNKLQVIYNPHNFEEIEKMSNLPLGSAFEESLFQHEIILFLGRLSLVKAPWHLLKAFSLMDNPRDSIKLVFVGDGDIRITSYLFELASQLGIKENVFFLGRKSNPYSYLKRSSVLALTSYYEGTPNVIVEAIACSTPIVSSNCTDGLRELMCINEYSIKGSFIDTESGIITPTFFKGDFSIPKQHSIINEEVIFGKALQKILDNKKYKDKLIQNSCALLNKFDLRIVSDKYLNNKIV